MMVVGSTANDVLQVTAPVAAAVGAEGGSTGKHQSFLLHLPFWSWTPCQAGLCMLFVDLCASVLRFIVFVSDSFLPAADD